MLIRIDDGKLLWNQTATVLLYLMLALFTAAFGAFVT